MLYFCLPMKRLLACLYLPLICFACAFANPGNASVQSAEHAPAHGKKLDRLSEVKPDLYFSAKPLHNVSAAKTEQVPGIRSNPDAFVSRQNLHFRSLHATRAYNALSLAFRHGLHARVIFPFHGFW